jgi:hypothetical protein
LPDRNREMGAILINVVYKLLYLNISNFVHTVHTDFRLTRFLLYDADMRSKMLFILHHENVPQVGL